MKNALLVHEAAKLLDAHPETVRRWERTGKLHARRDYRGYRIFSLSDVLRMKERREQLTEEAEQHGY